MNILEPTESSLRYAADALKAGDLVILPTETVYGLAGDATNEDALRRIFAAKHRPLENPLIVHLSRAEKVSEFARTESDGFQTLANQMWPGPLTMVLPKLPVVSPIISGGLDTVAVRVPDHLATLAVMEFGDLALAMPSANPFMGISPTRVGMIDQGLARQVACIIDGGPCRFGIESTVLDMVGTPKILRPGAITLSDIETALSQTLNSGGGDDERRSPGMYRRHYAPRTHSRIVHGSIGSAPGLTFHRTQNEHQISMPTEAGPYAAMVYAALAEMDGLGLTEFVIEAPPQVPEWDAVWDRLLKATAPELEAPE